MGKEGEKTREITVVGRNLYSALCLDALSKTPNAKLTWMQHQLDAPLRGEKHWLYFPDLKKLSFSVPNAIFVRPEKIAIYTDSGRRIPLPRFQQQGLRGERTQEFPRKSIREKIVAVAVWNDLTPPLWKDSLPNVRWPYSKPNSSAVGDWSGAALIPREASLSFAEQTFEREGVKIYPKNKHVIKMELGRLGDDNHLLHNPPHAFSKSPWTVWNTTSDAGLKRQSKVVARWVSYYANVPKAVIAPLPLLSVWLHNDHNSEFLNNGLISSGCMSRVLVIPQSDSDQDLLQIQELEFLPLKSEYKEKRVDRFLWELCPYLKREEISFRRALSDEDALFEEPNEIVQSIGKKSFFYWQGPMGNPARIKAKIF